MQLGGWDIILGGDWIYQYSPITFDFKELNIQFDKEGDKCVLQGSVQHTTMKLVRGKALKSFNVARAQNSLH